MEISKQAMITAIEAAITRHEKAERAHKVATETYATARKAEHYKRNMAAMRKLRDVINQASKSRRWVTLDEFCDALGIKDYQDLYRNSTHSPFTMVDPSGVKKPEALYSVDLVKLKSLHAALKAIVGDTITDHQLRTMGYSRVEWIFTAAVAG